MSETTPPSKVTIHDVAQAAGVSISTVSRAFARPGRVSAATAKRIRQIADELGYRSHIVDARTPYDEEHLHGMLAITVADIANPVFADYVKAAQHQCLRKGFGLVVIDSEETGVIERSTLQLTYGHVDGFILASSRSSDTAIRKIAEIKPVVTLNRPVRGLPSIIADSTHGLNAAVKRLIELGHTSLTYLSGPAASWQDGMRWRVINQLSSEHRIKLRRVPCESPSYGGGYNAAKTFLASPTSAVIAYNDNIAIGFVAALKHQGMTVPDDVSVVGIDDLPVSVLVEPPISSVRMPRRLLGEQAVDELIGRLHHTINRPSTEPVMLRSSFVERASIAAPHD